MNPVRTEEFSGYYGKILRGVDSDRNVEYRLLTNFPVDIRGLTIELSGKLAEMGVEISPVRREILDEAEGRSFEKGYSLHRSIGRHSGKEALGCPTVYFVVSTQVYGRHDELTESNDIRISCLSNIVTISEIEDAIDHISRIIV